MAMEDWGGLGVSISELVSYSVACTSFVCMLLKAHAWHLWRMLFGWLKLKSYRTAKYWILFGWLIALNAQFWERSRISALQHYMQNSLRVTVGTEDGESHQLILQPGDVFEYADLYAVAYAPMRTDVDTDFGSDNPIVVSGCGQSIYPRSWLEGMGEKLWLRPARLQLRAANGGRLGMLGTTTVKFRMPRTVEWIEHEVMVADHGAVPNHVHILGNDFLKKVRATWL
jgi:hypothetical protein